MGKIAFVFPGQGSQVVGMGKDLRDKFTEIAEIYDLADKILNFPISNLSFEGPTEELKSTANTQAALLLNSYVLLQAMRLLGKDIKADFLAGHSLGEYSALLAAGAFDFETALALVRYRGIAMEAAGRETESGKMAAVLGMDRDLLTDICCEVSTRGEIVQLANLNCPGQIIISGSGPAVDRVSEEAKAKGAKRIIELEVSGPFHSALMSQAQDQLATYMEEVFVKDIEVSVIANVTARPVQTAKEIKELLIKQVTASVLWEDSIDYLLDQGVDTFIEIGPGKVLAGLIKKINRDVRVYNVFDYESVVNLAVDLEKSI